MMGKFGAILDLFRKGSAVSDPAAWKKKQITVTMLGGLLIAIVQTAKAFGYDLGLDEDSATAIAGGILAVVNWVCTLTTTDKVGVLPAKAAEPTVDVGSSTDEQPVSTPKTVQVIRDADYNSGMDYRG